MDKSTAIAIAANQLEMLLKTQPNLLAYSAADENRGSDAAKFCIGFMDTYAAWAEKQDSSPD